MDLHHFKEWFTYKHMLELINQYQSFGVLVGFFFPFFDAFLAIFPLFVVIAVNVTAFGFWPGFLISWFGSVTGTLLVFFLLRKIGHRKLTAFLYRPEKRHPILERVDRSGFGPIFVLLCFPFTPSFFLNVFAAVSNIRVVPYIWANILGKAVMIFTVSLIGYDAKALVHRPIKATAMGLVIAALWYIGKVVERKLSESKAAKE